MENRIWPTMSSIVEDIQVFNVWHISYNLQEVRASSQGELLERQKPGAKGRIVPSSTSFHPTRHRINKTT